MMRTLLLGIVLAVAGIPAVAQDRTLVFTDEVRLPATPVRDQGRSSSCWCFSGISFVESELIRQHALRDTASWPALSEAFVLSHSLHDRAVKYVRLDGALRAAPGSEGADVLEVIRLYGMMPREVFPAPDFTVETNLFRELTTSVRAYLKGIVNRRDKALSPGWLAAFDGLLAGYLGPVPETFEHGGRQWTAPEYRDSRQFDASAYINIASVTDVPYGETFVLPIMDNWRWTPSLNLPLDEMVAVIDKALDRGYTVHIAADITQRGHQRDGYATVVPEDASHTLALPGEEPVTTPESRQAAWDSKRTTDDHALHLVGRARDQYGRKFYIVKDSHGDYGPFHGYLYMSEEYARLNILHILVHEDVLRH